ncbi:rab proteins geranylgeranyltransferase component A 1 [Thalassophryne amazonica]|uniref:rab proteins geranylgeranyltransferase component A 1 n=1 Tax=Thalassophryne amazonica TaxID=390379 RepID=UPI001471FC86|nr:rab proteins geranylgeranyltransferase component A 1 [Thalassophryne amazonica]
MAAEELPSDFDVVVLGTGLAESVVAAACARVGQRVLHVDRRSYYAANWASFNFSGLLTWIQQHQEACEADLVQDWSSLLEDGEEIISLSNSSSASISNVQVFCYTSEEDEEDEVQTPAAASTTEEAADDDGSLKSDLPADPCEVEQKDAREGQGEGSCVSPAESQSEPTRKISYAKLVKEGRQFNIDLVSKLIFSRGSLVNLLIKSNVSRYAEFKNITRILTYHRGNIEQVPCSRADVFANRQLSVIEKRKLMRFLSSCVEEGPEQQAFSGRPYLEFLRGQELSENLQHFLLHSIAMVTADTPTEVGLASTRHFLHCLGHYGNTPFLFPVYGLGEIPQCFCRMCAVFGGIYCLRHSIHCLLIDKNTNRCKAVIDSRGQRISCSHFVLEEGYVGAEQKQGATPTRSVSRAVLITDGSILHSESDQQISMVTVPPEALGHPAVRMVELCPSTMTCIPGTYLVHLTCQSVDSAYHDLSPVVTRMFHTPESSHKGNRPSVLWCLYFNMADGAAVQVEGYNLPSNVHVCAGPDVTLGHEGAVTQAKSIFQRILPNEEFCPLAPNPEDIIYDGDSSSTPPGNEDQQEEEWGGVSQVEEEERGGVSQEEEEWGGVSQEEEEWGGVRQEEEERGGVRQEEEEERGGVRQEEEEERGGVRQEEEEERGGVRQEEEEEERGGVRQEEEEERGGVKE